MMGSLFASGRLRRGDRALHNKCRSAPHHPDGAFRLDLSSGRIPSWCRRPGIFFFGFPHWPQRLEGNMGIAIAAALP